MDINAELVAKLGLVTKQFEKALDDASRKAESAGKKQQVSFRGTATAAAAVTAAVVATVKALGDLAARGDKVSAVQRGFGRVVGDTARALSLARDATMGLVSDFELMTQANLSLKLGSAQTVEEFSRLASVAQRLGRVLGLDTAFALNSLNIGIARQSRLVLDNLGIIVDTTKAYRTYAAEIGVAVGSLSEYQQKQAFANEAMRQAEEAADAMGDNVATAGTSYGQLATEVKNAANSFTQWVANSGILKTFFDGLASQVRVLRYEIGQLDADIRNRARTYGLPTAPGVLSVGRPDLGGVPDLSTDISINPLIPNPLLTRTGGPTGRRDRRFDTLTGQATGLETQFGGFVPNLGLGFDPGAPGALGGGAGVANRRAGLLSGEELRETTRRTEEWNQTILRVASTIEGVLVRSLTKAILQFESISGLVKDIGRSLLGGVVGGLVSFGVNALTGNILGAAGLAQQGAGLGLGQLGLPAARSPSTASVRITAESIPEPTDFGMIATKPQVARMVMAIMDNAQKNGYGR